MDRPDKNTELNPRRWPEGRGYTNKLTGTISAELLAAKVPLLSPSELYFIHDVPRILGNGQYGNLGHSGGASALAMGDCIRELGLDARVYSVDFFETAKEHRNSERNLAKWPNAAKHITMCIGTTDLWSTRFEPNYFNFVFIDADHSYPAVKRDAINWMPLVKPGGWISFHDTNQEFSHNAIEETIAKAWTERKDYHIDRIRTFQRPVA